MFKMSILSSWPLVMVKNVVLNLPKEYNAYKYYNGLQITLMVTAKYKDTPILGWGVAVADN